MIGRAAAGGFALAEPEWDDAERELRLVVRQRRDLVQKCSAERKRGRESLTVLSQEGDDFSELSTGQG